MKNNKLKSLILILILITNIAFAQKVHVNWSDFYNKSTGILTKTNIKINDKFYFFIGESKIARFDNNLKYEKSFYLPAEFEGKTIVDYVFTRSGNDFIITGKCYETKKAKNYTLIKAITDIDLSKTIKFEKVIDEETVLSKTYLNNNKIMIMTSPQESAKERNIYKFTIYDEKYTNKEWTAELDLSDLLKDFDLVSRNYFSENKEYIFIMRTKEKFLKNIKDKYLLCKFTKEKGLETLPFDFGENITSYGINIFIDIPKNVIYVKNTFDAEFFKSKKNMFIVKKFDFVNMIEVFSKTVDLGPETQKCFNGKVGFGLVPPSYSIDDFILKSFKINEATEQLQIIGELVQPYTLMDAHYRGNQTEGIVVNGVNGSIIVVNFDSSGNYVSLVIPHKVKTTSFDNKYNSFYLANYQNKTCFLFYDSDKNANNALCNENTKTKYIKDYDNNELYMVLIDKNNKVEKVKPLKTFEGDEKNIKEFKPLELDQIFYLNDNRYLVKSEYFYGILTIE